MPLLDHAGARLYFEELGDGPPILTTHGVTENHLYWKLPGLVDRLAAAGYRVISTDMRGHGRSSASATPAGYEVSQVAADLGAVADHLGLDRFHLLTHATGGMAGLRYAMGASDRLLSLMSTNTGAATYPTDAAAEITDPAATLKDIRAEPNRAAQNFRGRPWYQIIKGARDGAQRDVFLNSMHLAVDPKAAFDWYEACVRLGDPDTLAEFMAAFYTDPNPYIARLRAITCPCLVLVGERDEMFLKPSIQLAREIPNARFVQFEGRGHMTAWEDPRRTGDELLGFLAGLRGG